MNRFFVDTERFYAFSYTFCRLYGFLFLVPPFPEFSHLEGGTFLKQIPTETMQPV